MADDASAQIIAADKAATSNGHGLIWRRAEPGYIGSCRCGAVTTVGTEHPDGVPDAATTPCGEGT